MTQKTKNDQSTKALLAALVFVAVAGAVGLALLASRLGQAPESGPIANATLTDFNGITVLEAPQEVADFTLTDQNGEPMRLSDMRGKPTLRAGSQTQNP